jgi:hypothetical protein
MKTLKSSSRLIKIVVAFVFLFWGVISTPSLKGETAQSSYQNKFLLHFNAHTYINSWEIHNQIRTYNVNTRLDQAFYPSSPTREMMQPIALSPDGEYLVVGSQPWGGTSRYCVLNRQGKLQSCLPEPPTPADEHWSVNKEDAFVQWHGGNIWYLTQQDTTFRILEADPVTGRTLRTIFEQNVDRKLFEGAGAIPSFSIASDGSHILVGASGYNLTSKYKPEHRVSAYLHDLKSGTKQEISLDVLKNILRYSDSNNVPTFCGSDFTPSGKYLILRTITNIFVLDKNLKSATIIPQPSSNPELIIGCPEWSKDDSTFYVITSSRDPFGTHPVNIYSYRMSEAKYKLRKSIEEDVGRGFFAAASPDGNSLGFILRRRINGHVSPVAHILTEFDELIQLEIATHMVWSPLLTTPATPQPPPNIILPPAQPTLINPLPGGGGE